MGNFSNLLKYTLKRLGLALLILFVISVILYTLMKFMPSSEMENQLLTQLSTGAITQEEFDRQADMLGLYDKGFMDIFNGYFKWLGSILQGDFGVSLKSGKRVVDQIRDTMGVSFTISFISLILQLIIAIPLGIKCATSQYGKFDYTTTVICMTFMAFPSFFLGNLFIKWFAVDLGWFPVGGNISGNEIGLTWWESLLDQAYHLVLPMIVLVLLSVGGLMRYTRTNTLEVLNADYIRTARAKGLSENAVIYKHVFRNTLIPLVTQLAYMLPGLFGGSMITESVFAIEGIGQAAYNALSAVDIPFIMAYNMFIAVLSVTGVLLADIAYSLVDPRVKLGG